MIIRIVIDTLFVVGIFFTFSGVVGMFRMPDTLCRLQAAANISTMGVLPILLGTSIYGFFRGSSWIGGESLIAIIVILVGSPICSQNMARTAYRSNLKLSDCTKYDDYGRDKVDE